ncbi:hypothetical protein VNO77_33282 [Canavalia gladiata]|uniref:Uncharacterized protein n=1 Tax=Canavalia gladiata TaxID=3824 RepID=A0AAN9KFB4_CANGL
MDCYFLPNLKIVDLMPQVPTTGMSCTRSVSKLYKVGLLVEKDFKTVKGALQEAFLKIDMRLLKWLEVNREEDEYGATTNAVIKGSGRKKK